MGNTLVSLFILTTFLASSPAMANALTPGELWNTSTEVEKIAYVSGFRDGEGYVFTMLLVGGQVGAQLKRVREHVKQEIDQLQKLPIKVFCSMMDEIYSDPANALIDLNEVLIIADEKLRGNPDADKDLLDARRMWGERRRSGK